MDSFRFALAVITIVTLPVVIVFWVFIHATARHVRHAYQTRARRSVQAVYWTALVLMLVCGSIVIWNLDFLIGSDMGFSWPLFLIGTATYLFSHWLAVPIRKHLNFRTFAGLPEVSGQPVKLLDRGPYGVVRHPRYLMVIVGVIGWALMANYSGAYTVSALSIIGLLVVVALEERDLIDRFGDEYRDYQKRVPQLIPRPGSLRGYFDAQ